MYKVAWLFKRKPGLSHEAFREIFESRHPILAKKHFGHLLVEYRRNYASEAWSGGDPKRERGAFAPSPWAYDCLSEWVMPNREAFDEIMRILADPVIGQEFDEDEERFLDRTSSTLIHFDVVDTGVSV
jgi:hypothetical protein